MKITTLIFTLLISITLYGQGFAPIGSKWYYTNIENFFSPNKGYVKIESVGDTVIQGKKCRHLTKLRYSSNGFVDSESDEFLYIKEDTVYRFSDNDTFYILYNFAAQVGDTWTTRTYDLYAFKDVETTVRVDSISMISINNEMLKQIYVSTIDGGMSFGGNWSAAGGQARIIEKLGGTWYMFPQDYGFWDFEIRIGLRCYEDSLFGMYNAQIVPDCEYLITNTKDLQSVYGIKVFPKPASEKFYVDIENDSERKEVLVYSMDGRLIKRKIFRTGDSRMEIPVAEKGLHILVIRIGDSKFYFDKVLML